MAHGAGRTCDNSLPIAKLYHVVAIYWDPVAGKTQAYLPWNSWHYPYIEDQSTVWFHGELRQDDTT